MIRIKVGSQYDVSSLHGLLHVKGFLYKSHEITFFFWQVKSDTPKRHISCTRMEIESILVFKHCVNHASRTCMHHILNQLILCD